MRDLGGKIVHEYPVGNHVLRDDKGIRDEHTESYSLFMYDSFEDAYSRVGIFTGTLDWAIQQGQNRINMAIYDPVDMKYRFPDN